MSQESYKPTTQEVEVAWSAYLDFNDRAGESFYLWLKEERRSAMHAGAVESLRALADYLESGNWPKKVKIVDLQEIIRGVAEDLES